MEKFEAIRKLYDIYDDKFACSEKDIRINENRLKLRFPETLKKYYINFGKNEQLNNTQDNLLSLDKIYIINSYLVFYAENQYVAVWGIKLSDLHLENPPVYISYDEKEWILESKNLSDYFISMAYLQSIFALEYNAHALSLEEKRQKFVQENWEKVGNTLSIWNVSFYQNSFNEVIAIMQNEDQFDIFVATKTEKQFEEIENKLNIEWDFSSLDED